MMDGAPTNRKIVSEVEKNFNCFATPNLLSPGAKITYIMDPKVGAACGLK